MSTTLLILCTNFSSTHTQSDIQFCMKQKLHFLTDGLKPKTTFIKFHINQLTLKQAYR